MEAAVQNIGFFCPQCGAWLTPMSLAVEKQSCPKCRWSGKAYLFKPIKYDAASPEEALPDNATCAHHPTKKAIAVCEGSGNYICPLCVVEIDGKTYSVQHVDAKGRASFGRSFDRTMKRPDYYMPAFFFFLGMAPFFFPFAIVGYLRMRRQYTSDPLYRRLIGRMRLGAYGVLTVLLTMFAALIGVMVIADLMGYAI